MLTDKKEEELLSKEETKKFAALMIKIDKENPDSKDLREAEIMISKNLCLYKLVLGYSDSILDRFINKLESSKALQFLIKAEVVSIKDGLDYKTANQVEKLVIDQIMFCWAGMNYMESKVHDFLLQDNYNMVVAEYWQESLSRYQNRYLRSIETLARVRKLNKSIALQVNIAADGGQQLNVNEVNK